MKVCLKEILVTGGIYGVLVVPFVYVSYLFDSGFDFGFNAGSMFLLFMFVCCAVRLCLNSNPVFIADLMESYPTITYYLSSFGWVPYFIFVYLAMVFGLGYVVDFSYKETSILAMMFYDVVMIGVPVSLLTAFVMTFTEEKLKGQHI